MTEHATRQCPYCPKRTVAQTRWQRLSSAARARLRDMGVTRRALGDGTCLYCYRSLKAQGASLTHVSLRHEARDDALAAIARGDEDCIEWGGGRDGGYGRYGGRWAHRMMYELAVGAIPPGLHLDHLCRNTACVNPRHLEPVTVAENNRRAALVRTHCKQGHEFTEENTYRYAKGRVCKTCTLSRQRAKYAERQVGAA